MGSSKEKDMKDILVNMMWVEYVVFWLCIIWMVTNHFRKRQVFRPLYIISWKFLASSIRYIMWCVFIEVDGIRLFNIFVFGFGFVLFHNMSIKMWKDYESKLHKKITDA